jgi:hypothetical protein
MRPQATRVFLGQVLLSVVLQASLHCRTMQGHCHPVSGSIELGQKMTAASKHYRHPCSLFGSCRQSQLHRAEQALHCQLMQEMAKRFKQEMASGSLLLRICAGGRSDDDVRFVFVCKHMYKPSRSVLVHLHLQGDQLCIIRPCASPTTRPNFSFTCSMTLCAELLASGTNWDFAAVSFRHASLNFVRVVSAAPFLRPA